MSITHIYLNACSLHIYLDTYITHIFRYAHIYRQVYIITMYIFRYTRGYESGSDAETGHRCRYKKLHSRQKEESIKAE